jgi:chromosome segregation protein
MRLTRIKLAGFKSFVDPTSIHFPSNLTGIIGPNGCGKSNVIDAVRWVMGEISATRLRGDSMADVIFNGSSARKPVGTASIELVFDNSDGAVGGQYASYAEVSLKRVVSRDGTSVYLINGARCRRKDITALFLGTGLGSRSYAIIEQGMISRLIEAKPEDLRAFIEEAAGISKYKERRRETENRIGHTRENLERLNDLREEVEKQIRHLQRQAATARRYQALKEEERKLGAELLALRLRELEEQAANREQATREREISMQAAIADLRAVEASIEKARVHHTERTDRLNDVQASYYQLGADATRLEQSIQHARELRQRQRTDLEQAELGSQELATQLRRDEAQAHELLAALSDLQPRHVAAQERESASAQRQRSLESALQDWQARWEEHGRGAGAAEQGAQVERARIEEIENRLRHLRGQVERIRVERKALESNETAVQLELLSDRELVARQAGETARHELEGVQRDIQSARDEEKQTAAQLEEARTNGQTLQGRLVSLEALQQAALGQAQGRVMEWLASHKLAQRPRLAQQIRVQKGWERAVETVLGGYLEAVCVDGLDAVTAVLDQLDAGQVTFLLAQGGERGELPAQSLLAKVEGPGTLKALLGHVYAVDNLGAALVRRAFLRAGESIITRDGIWIGEHWLRVSRDRDAHAGVIEREQEIQELRAEVSQAEQQLRRLEGALAKVRDRATGLEARREELQSDVNRRHAEHSGLSAQLDASRDRATETAARLEGLNHEHAALEGQAQEADTGLQAARVRLEQAASAMQALQTQRATLEEQRERLRTDHGVVRAQAEDDRAHAREVEIQLESRRAAQSATLAGLERMRTQLAQLQARREELADQIRNATAPLADMERSLEQALSQKVAVEGELRAAREALEAAEAASRGFEEQRVGCETRVDEVRGAMEQARLASQEIRVRRESLAEQFAATHFDLDVVLGGLAPEATISAWEQTLADTVDRVVRLGSVNLAAIEEFKEQSERKDYLDRQFADLTEALATLETAIRRIDKETRHRFQDTFDRINAGLKEKFPRLFGGGHAYLEMTGEDVLSAGVAVMARPPGKRNSTIHLLSGGEKALTAVALVFSIFDLNPAPFCLLDEVDAPLDDHNVGRFCEIVREMSQRVQFLFITHNKATMELASQLIGVTMSEPGVSRLVAVDVDEAMRMAAM